MNTTIWKYTLPNNGIRTMDLPKGAEVRSVKHQQDKLCLFAQVNPKAETDLRTFLVAYTGEDLTTFLHQNQPLTVEKLHYIGTQQIANLFEHLVVHIFEVK